MPVPTPGPSRPARRRRTVILLIGLAALAGCRPADRVSQYTAPKDPTDPDLVSDEPGPGEHPVRVLGAIAPAGKPGEDSWYVFKFQGPKSTDLYPPKAIER